MKYEEAVQAIVNDDKREWTLQDIPQSWHVTPGDRVRAIFIGSGYGNAPFTALVNDAGDYVKTGAGVREGAYPVFILDVYSRGNGVEVPVKEGVHLAYVARSAWQSLMDDIANAVLEKQMAEQRTEWTASAKNFLHTDLECDLRCERIKVGEPLEGEYIVAHVALPYVWIGGTNPRSNSLFVYAHCPICGCMAQSLERIERRDELHPYVKEAEVHAKVIADHPLLHGIIADKSGLFRCFNSACAAYAGED